MFLFPEHDFKSIRSGFIKGIFLFVFKFFRDKPFLFKINFCVALSLSLNIDDIF